MTQFVRLSWRRLSLCWKILAASFLLYFVTTTAFPIDPRPTLGSRPQRPNRRARRQPLPWKGSPTLSFWRSSFRRRHSSRNTSQAAFQPNFAKASSALPYGGKRTAEWQEKFFKRKNHATAWVPENDDTPLSKSVRWQADAEHSRSKGQVGRLDGAPLLGSLGAGERQGHRPSFLRSGQVELSEGSRTARKPPSHKEFPADGGRGSRHRVNATERAANHDDQVLTMPRPPARFGSTLVHHQVAISKENVPIKETPRQLLLEDIKEVNDPDASSSGADHDAHGDSAHSHDPDSQDAMTAAEDLMHHGKKEAELKKTHVASEKNTAKFTELHPWIAYMICGVSIFGALICIFGCLRVSRKFQDPQLNPYLDKEPELSYNPEELTTWRAFSFMASTIFVDGRMWELAATLCLTAVSCCLLVLLFVDNPAELKVDRFNEVTKLLKVFVAFMLGLYVSASYNRFLSIVGGVFNLFNACKSMLTMAGTLGVPPSQRATLGRYGVLAVNLLSYEVQLMYMPREQVVDKWKEAFGELQKRQLFKGKERDMLESALLAGAVDISQLVIIWVESYIAKLSIDGYIPAMPTPTYGRMMQVSVSEAQKGLRTIKQSVRVQTPFTYVHLLAVMVHVNNAMTAVMGGVMIGTTVGKVMQGTYGFDKGLQSFIITVFTFTVGPFLYQAFLIIGASMAEPFDQEDAADNPVLPMEKLAKELQDELALINDFVGNPPDWDPPSFRK